MSREKIVASCADDFKKLRGLPPHTEENPYYEDDSFARAIERKYPRVVRDEAEEVLSGAKSPEERIAELESLVACYRQLWSRIPEEVRRKNENALVEWANEEYRVPWLKEHKERNDSDDWRPELGECSLTDL